MPGETGEEKGRWGIFKPTVGAIYDYLLYNIDLPSRKYRCTQKTLYSICLIRRSGSNLPIACF